MQTTCEILETSAARSGDDRLADDVLRGLSGRPKRLPSMYFYDARGSRLFQQITRQPEYYLTRCELEVLERNKGRLAEIVQDGPFRLVELGVGDGRKTEVLLTEFLDRELDFEFVPIDICRESLEELADRLESRLGAMALSVRALVGEYWDALRELNGQSDLRNVVLFMGSNIGNFGADEARDFLCQLRNSLREGDLALIGFDLKKDLGTIHRAYNDAAGVTRQFNLNLLERINRELQADFRPELFEHHGFYNPAAGRMESWLVATEAHEVHLGSCDRRFAFDAWEAVHVESSQKFTLGEIEQLAEACGFGIGEHYLDRRGWFVDSLWRAVA